MPTAVENNAGFEYGANHGFEYGGKQGFEYGGTQGFEYGGSQGFEYGGLYPGRLLASRGIPASLVKAVVARGRGTSVGAGKTLFSDDWTARSGKRWQLFVITLGGVIVTSWVEQG
jgi:hypothetical protein